MIKDFLKNGLRFNLYSRFHNSTFIYLSIFLYFFKKVWCLMHIFCLYWRQGLNQKFNCLFSWNGLKYFDFSYHTSILTIFDFLNLIGDWWLVNQVKTVGLIVMDTFLSWKYSSSQMRPKERNGNERQDEICHFITHWFLCTAVIK